MNPRSLKPSAVEHAAKEIRRARYLMVSVSDEELVRRTVEAYQEAAAADRRPRQPKVRA